MRRLTQYESVKLVEKYHACNICKSNYSEEEAKTLASRSAKQQWLAWLAALGGWRRGKLGWLARGANGVTRENVAASSYWR